MDPRNIPVVILAGGLGTRISEETATKPKPMIEVGGKPLLWHIMKIYSAAGFRQFVVCLGYRGYVIKEYFSNYYLHNSDVTIELASNKTQIHKADVEDWSVTLVDTGDKSMTGGRLRRASDYIKSDVFCMTYGDGVSNVDLRKLLQFHEQHGRLATVTAVRLLARFGGLDLDGDVVRQFREKPVDEGDYINGGFFVLSREVLQRIVGDDTIWERQPLESLVADRQLIARRHEGFWWAVDTLRDKTHLDSLWEQGCPPWKTW